MIATGNRYARNRAPNPGCGSLNRQINKTCSTTRTSHNVPTASNTTNEIIIPAKGSGIRNTQSITAAAPT